ncbi:MAG: hypothetical protein WC838_00785 [Candidatus Margulisiibacteriota bacterium]|jgi:hypothetical protein
MKKVLWYSFLVLVVLSLTGCGSTSSSSGGGGGGGTSLTAASAATYSGQAAQMSHSMCSLAYSFRSAPPAKLNPNTNTHYTYDNATGLWSYVFNYSVSGVTFDSNYYIGLYATGSSVPASSPSPLDKVTMYGSYAYATGGLTYTMTMGSASAPLTWSGMAGGTITFTGAMSTLVDYNGVSSTVEFTSNNLTMSGGDLPTGTMSFAVKQNGSTIYSGTMTFNGTTTATLTFGNYTYHVDLLAGSVTAV